MEPSVEVHHCLLVRQGMPDESWRTPGSPEPPPWAFRGVRYHHEVPPDTEFPTDAKPPWAVFLRLTGRRAGPTRVLFRIDYDDPRDGWRELSRIPCWTAIALPGDDDATHDVVLNLPYLRLGGVGLHALTVHFWYDGIVLNQDEGSWDSEDSTETIFRTQEWAFGTAEYFWIRRSP